MNKKEKQLFDAIEYLTYHLTTSIGEVVEVLGQISQSVNQIKCAIDEIERRLYS